MKLIILVGLFSIWLPSSIQAGMVHIDASADATTWSLNPSANFQNLFSERSVSSWNATAWFKFDLSPIVGLNVVAARFEMSTNVSHFASGFSHDLYSSSDDSWVEGLITYENQPSTGTLNLVTSEVIAGPGTYSFDVLSAIYSDAGLSGANNDLSLMVRPDLNAVMPSPIVGPHIYDREVGNPELRPRLLIMTEPVVAVPEPSTLALVSIGSLTLFGCGRRRKRQCSPEIKSK